MTARDYYRSVLQLLPTSAVVAGQRIEFDEQDVHVAYLKGSVSLIDGSTLFFAQYVQIEALAVIRSPARSTATTGRLQMGKRATAGIMPGIIQTSLHSQITSTLGLTSRCERIVQRTYGR